MPAIAAAPAFYAALATGAAGVGAAAIESRSKNKAARMEQESANQALAYQRERQAVEDRRYDQRWQAYQDAVAAWKQRNGLAPGSPAPAEARNAALGGPVGVQRYTLADLGGAGAPAAAPVSMDPSAGIGATPDAGGAAPKTLADLQNWNDWRPYLQAQA